MVLKQTRKASLAETLLNMAIGYAINLGAQMVIFPLFGIYISLGSNVAIGLAFTVISIARGYVLRRFFEALRVKGILP
jgi:hypothetical protein